MDATFRATCRTQFTKLCNSINEFLKNTKEEPSRREEINIFLQRLRNAHERLRKADDAVKPFLKEEDMIREFEATLEYDDKAVALIAKLEFLLLKERGGNGSGDEVKGERGDRGEEEDFMGVKLKAIELKQFDGKFENWLPFWEQFRRVVHNNKKIPPTTKFSYLSQALIGIAATTITGFTPSEKCYNDAITLLQEQYGNSDKIVEKYVQKLLEMKAVQSPSDLKGLRSLYNDVTAIIRTLAALQISSSQYAIIIKSIILKCLPSKLRIEYHKKPLPSALNVSTHTVVDTAKAEDKEELENLLAFIKTEVEALEKAKMSDVESTERFNGPKNMTRGTAVGLLTNSTGAQKQCLFCKSTKHNTQNCNSDISIVQRKSILQREGRCYRCSGKNHTSRFCKSQWVKCERCKGRHITSLCEGRNQQRNEPHEKANQTCKSTNERTAAAASSLNITATLSASHDKDSNIYLQTAKSILCGENNNKKLLTRIIMDNGSQKTYISEKVAKELELSVIGEEMSRIVTFGETKNKQMTNMKKVKVNVRSQYNNNSIEIIAIVVPTICADILPVPNENVFSLRFAQFDLAERIVSDENFMSGINMLIGQDSYWKFNSLESKLIDENLVAVKTFFGWTIQGGSSENTQTDFAFNTLHEREEGFKLSNFWNLEALGITADNSEATTPVDINFVNGRYEVSLPWKTSNEFLNDNKKVAKRRLNGLTIKLISDKIKMQQYHNGMQELINNGIAEKVVDVNTENPIYYMPHRPVYRDDKLTTKMRIVFDASSSEPELLSLNEHLSAGENLVADLLTILIRFRSNQIAITADIEKAFLQISLNRRERDSHRFLWYDSLPNNTENLPRVAEYRMSRVTFGVTSSPYLLAATIKKHLQITTKQYGTICEKLQKSFYVDDLILSVATYLEAKYVVTTATEIMSSANFKLRKWSTNDINLRKTFTSDGIEQPIIQKVLGTSWCTASDTISVDLRGSIQMVKRLRPTKRNITKAMASVFDPLGILGPFTVRIKLLLQSVWKEKIPWDQTLSDEFASEFQNWQEELQLLSDMTIPRCLAKEKNTTIQLHIFADASPQAYGAVAYVRTVNSKGNIETLFICSKNRVSPLNKCNENELTLPKLELTAALVAARLKQFILTSIDLTIESVTLWTDSTIALNWILGCAKKIKPYITPRVKEINNLTSIYQWQHCDGKSNPADLLTRGIKAENLLNSKIWKRGPTWLSDMASEWPKSKICLATINTTNISNECATIEENNPILTIENFSKYKRLIRTTAFVLRFIKHVKDELKSSIKRKKFIKPVSSVEELTADEIRQAELYWIEQQQQKFYSEEISSIKRTGEIHKTSKIVSLNPILINNVLRVKSRMPTSNNDNSDNTSSNPIILPKHSWLSVLIVYEAHKDTLHGGINMVLTYIRRTYWIIQGRQLIKSILHKCVICKRLHGKCGSQPWVVLPVERIQTSRPFETTGVDFAGPLYVKEPISETLNKAYIMLFTCASIRAVHLELVENLSVKSCIEALRRFIARRGAPSVIMSDNAKTFKRADREITKLFQFLEADKVQQSTAHKGIVWKYIPERAAWWGGFWERLVRSVKTAIKASIGRELLTSGELATFLTEVESIINNRPLTYVSSDEKDLEPLTPSHFLHHGTSVLPNTNINFAIDQKSLSRSWQLRQSVLKRYLKRWQCEYLNQLRAIYHNTSGLSRSIKIGDIVLLQEDLKSRLLWKMAVVEAVYPGRDGRVRSCDVRLANNNVLKRPIQLLVPLEISSSMAVAEDVENISRSGPVI